jgi:chemotaxis signal transduction protein
VRKGFRLREREIDLDDSIVIVKGLKWAVAFAVDSVEGVIERSDEEIISSGKILPGMEHTEGVVKIGDDIVFLHDIYKALSFEEKDTLNKVMEKHETVA